MILDHVGIVVEAIEPGIAYWERLFGYHPCSPIVTNTRQKVRVVFLHKPDSLTVKLIEPTGSDSPIASFARRGGGLHHLCFRCENLQTAISSLDDAGVHCLVPPEPGEAFDLHPIAFMMGPDNLHFELIDTEVKVLLPGTVKAQ